MTRTPDPKKERGKWASQKGLIELCEDFLTRARSGALEGIAVVEIRDDNRINGRFRNLDADQAMRASAFMGYLAVKNCMKPDHES
jgi:hypothetical protein